MKSIWSTLYDDVKDRRYAALFLLGPLAVLGALALAACLLAALHALELLPYAICAAALWSVWMLVRFCRSVARSPERWQRQELSCDEWRVARSKLKSGLDKFNSIKPAVRLPDTDLKI